MGLREGTILIVGVLVLSTAAFADGGKAGAWKRTLDTHISDPTGALYQLPPAMVKQLRDQTEGTRYFGYCMSAADVAANKIALSSTCATGDVSVSGQTLSADYTCTGDSPGRGTVSITYDTPEHYTGDMLFVPKAGSKLKWKSKLEGQWLGETCPAN